MNGHNFKGSTDEAAVEACSNRGCTVKRNPMVGVWQRKRGGHWRSEKQDPIPACKGQPGEESANTTPPTEPQRLRVWHIPQVPGKPFHVEVRSIEEAIIVMDALAEYDLFQEKQQIIHPDHANAQGLEVLEDLGEGLEWVEWYDEEGNDIAEHRALKRRA